MSLWGSAGRHKPSVTTLYQLVVKEAVYRGLANMKTLPGFGDAYYVEDAIHRNLGIEHAFGTYSVTGATHRFQSGALPGIESDVGSIGSGGLLTRPTPMIQTKLTGWTGGVQVSSTEIVTNLPRRSFRGGSKRCAYRQRGSGLRCLSRLGHSGKHVIPNAPN